MSGSNQGSQKCPANENDIHSNDVPEQELNRTYDSFLRNFSNPPFVDSWNQQSNHLNSQWMSSYRPAHESFVSNQYSVQPYPTNLGSHVNENFQTVESLLSQISELQHQVFPVSSSHESAIRPNSVSQHSRQIGQIPITYGSLEAMEYMRNNSLFSVEDNNTIPNNALAALTRDDMMRNVGFYEDSISNSMVPTWNTQAFNSNSYYLNNETIQNTPHLLNSDFTHPNMLSTKSDADTILAPPSASSFGVEGNKAVSRAEENSYPISSRRQTGSFTVILHFLLEKAVDIGYEKFVSWQSHGRAFRVHDPLKFAAVVMPQFFSQTQYPSFQRQLSLYVFKRMSRKGKDRGAYYHEGFLRGFPRLCHALKRVGPSKGVTKKDGSKKEPNFYEMESLQLLNNIDRNPECQISNDFLNIRHDSKVASGMPEQIFNFKSVSSPILAAGVVATESINESLPKNSSIAYQQLKERIGMDWINNSHMIRSDAKTEETSFPVVGLTTKMTTSNERDDIKGRYKDERNSDAMNSFRM